jgi:ATP-dependent Clp protease adaptor protein ClpS
MPANTDTVVGTGGALDVLERTEERSDHGWNVILWNDPINLVPYVIATLIRILEIGPEDATELTQKVHVEGKAAAFNGTQAEAEAKMAQLQAATLWATLERA